MSTLENFIRENRNELDVFTPSQNVWNAIEANMHNPTFIKSSASWLKYAGFSASVIAVLVYLKINTSSEVQNPVPPAPEKKIQIVGVSDAPALPAEALAKAGSSTATEPESETKPSFASSSAKATEDKEATEGKPAAPPAAAVYYTHTPTVESNTPALPAAAPVIGETRTAAEAEAPAAQPDRASAQRGGNRSGDWDASKDSLTIDTSFAGVKTIDVTCFSFDIKVVTVPGGKINFKAKRITEVKGTVISKGREGSKIKYERTDTSLKVIEERSCNKVVITGCVKETATMIFEVPASTNVIIHSSYGDIDVSGLNGKVCDLHAKSGDVKVNNVSTDLKLHLSYGDATASSVTGTVSGKVSSGNVTITDMKGNADIETQYGDQKYTDITGNVKAESSSGELKITNMKGNAEILSRYGDITLENFKGSPIMQASSGDIKGKNVELTEGMVATTSYGDIRMKLTNELNDLSFDLDTNYGTIQVEKDGQKMEETKKLSLKKGKILIKAHTSSGDQSYK